MSNVVLGPQASYTQTPRFNIYLGSPSSSGQGLSPCPNPLVAEVITTNYSEASRFSCRIIVTPVEADSFISMSAIMAKVAVSLNYGAEQPLIIGLVDTIEYDPITNEIVLAGRDLAGLLIDTPTQEARANLTSSQLVQQIIGQFAAQGLIGNVTPTSTKIGRYYSVDYSLTIFNQFYRTQHLWDLVQTLARVEGFEARVTGAMLYFGPPSSSNAPPYVVTVNQGPPIAANVDKLRLLRSLTLAKDVSVTVVSWNSMLGRAIIKVVRSSQQGAPKGGYGPVQNYVINKPDLTPQQALNLAEQALTDITIRERVVDISMPGELTINPSSLIQVVGTKTSFDQAYYIDEIRRTIGFEEGFHQSIRLKNISPETQRFTEPLSPLAASGTPAQIQSTVTLGQPTVRGQ